MKRCPKCSRTYPDDNQKFCTVDGGRLESADAAGTTSELGATVLTNPADLNHMPTQPISDFNKTVTSVPTSPTGEIRKSDTGPTANRTVAAPFQSSELPSQPPPAPPHQPPPTYQPPPPHQQQPPPTYQQQPPPPQYQQQPQPYQQPPYQQQPSAPMPHAPAPPPQMGGHAPQQMAQQPSPSPPRSGSRMPLIIGAVVLVLLLAGGVAYYFLVLNKKDQAGANTNANANANVANANDNANANLNANINGNANTSANANTAPPFSPPPDTTQFVNTRAHLSGPLADHFVPFSFYYPNAWELNTGIAADGIYFVRADRKLPPNYLQERFSVEWYESKGTYDADESSFPNLIAAIGPNLAKLPGYEKLSEGRAKVNSMAVYEITFKGRGKGPNNGDIDYWGRVIFLPPGDASQKNGLKLTLLTSSLAPELEGIDDVGVKGELPVILQSLRLK